MKKQEKLFYLLFILLAFAVNLSGITNAFFTDDPGLYGAIAKNMLYRNDWLSLYSYGQDWLDKPHFPFWMAAVSFKVFGISTWAYRLPALLFFAMSLWYTYLLGKKFYTQEIAFIAVLIVFASQYVIMSNTDVRAEPYLMGLITGAIYHITGLYDRFSVKDLLLAALLTACAIMTKGIFVLVVIYGSLLGQLIFTGNFRQVFSFKWIGLFILTLLLTAPEVYALYVQFDLHPEKTVFGRQDVSGIKWFLWDSQFGRFVNSGPISQQKSGDVFFYMHTLLWAFAPWCLLFYYALYKRIRGMIKKEKQPEFYTIVGSLLLLLLFSLSRFQLPFYTNILFPLFALITAPYCFEQLETWGNRIRIISWWLYIAAFTLGVFLINFLLQPDTYGWLAVGCIWFFGLINITSSLVKHRVKVTFFIAIAASLFANFYLATYLYPLLGNYNGQIAAAQYLNQPQFKDYSPYSLKQTNNVFQFECNRPVGYIPLEDFGKAATSKNMAYYANQQSIDYLREQNIPFKVMASFTNYPQERILPAFINKDKRETTLDKVYLITK
ncbi:ArnT family glycosyltransferase [Mucilaginibacter auburnensis]|uniref:4-amino-4-deoxy-L-arabinose transferase-like glycosyltransferase n=1 Tax=Mucilaginibacter auburnensis TaxID=1457233 RepID=A0A2H9VNM4_9SPHI|nr:glycosyltransferase family 39 protein [Mucilaginibacter auburnensis]PJJ79938.1 4-amino-4-deoxy-L-arabinose transferase-like glycosyltransferase [Mucilaginibacter auburnensis]